MTQAFRQRSLSSMASLCLGLLMTGCIGSTPAEGARLTASRTNQGPTICGTIKGELMALWDPSRDGNGGFGDTPTLASPPSLYYTAWSIRLAAAANIRLTNLDKTVVAKALIASALNSKIDVESARIPLVERLNLTTKALQALHLPVPESILNTLTTLRSGAQYRSDRTVQKTSWSATYLAAQTLATVGRRVPLAVIKGAIAALPIAIAANTPQAVMSLGVPILGTIGTTPGLLPRLVPNIATVLSSFTKILLSTGGVSAVTAAGLVSVTEIANEAGVLPPVVPSNFLASLVTPTGYYAVGQGRRHGDPQATFYAVRLGNHLTNTARTTLLWGHVRQGWLPTISAANLNSSFQASAVAHACHFSLPHTLPFSNQILVWLQDAAIQAKSKEVAPTPGGITSSSVLSAAEACWLAGVNDLAIPNIQHVALTNNVGLAARKASAVGADITEGGRVAFAVTRCHLTLPASARVALVAHLATAIATTAEDALSLHIASNAFNAPKLDMRAREIANRLKTSSGLFRFQARANAPDLISTAYGYAAGGGSRDDGARATANFNTAWGPGLGVTANSGKKLPIVDLASLAAGLSLLGTNDETPLLF